MIKKLECKNPAEKLTCCDASILSHFAGHMK